MHFAKPILLSLLTVALATYALDCEAVTTPEQAMQCCAAMHCSPRGHQGAMQGMDCCKTMSTPHTAFALPYSVHVISHNAVVFAMLPIAEQVQRTTSSPRSISAHSHAPPGSSSPALLPLRI